MNHPTILGGLSAGQVLQRTPEGASARVRFSIQAPISAVVTLNHSLVPSATWELRGPFEGRIGGLPPGGPFEVTFEGGTTVGPLYVGDLWLLGGQSNMEGMGDLADGPQPHPLVHRFSLSRRWGLAQEPLHAGDSHPTAKGVGPGLWFARQRAVETGIPQGLICTARGGTSLTEWSPGQTLYQAMAQSLRQIDQPLAGVLWYQGCNDTNPHDADCYDDKMVALVAAVRTLQNQPRLPWLMAQIGRVVGRQDDTLSWNRIQDLQRRLPDRVADLAVVGTVDLELDDWIHLSARAQQTLGHRFAVLARRLVDHDRASLPGPAPRQAWWDPTDPGGPAVRIRFDHVVGGWTPGPVLGFGLEDAQGRALPLVCRARVEGSDVVLRLTSDELGGLTVAYAQGCAPAATLTDGRNFGLPSFRGLAIDGLPPVTGWFRHWELTSIAEAPAMDSLPLPGNGARWQAHRTEGWWYLNLTAWWPRGAVAGRSRFSCAEAMTLEIRAGNDVPFRLLLDGTEVFSEDENPRLTSTNIAFEHHRRTVQVGAGDHEFAFVAQGRPGGMGLDLRLARTDGTLLPELR